MKEKEEEKTLPQQYSTIICGEPVKKEYNELVEIIRESGIVGYSFEKIT